MLKGVQTAGIKSSADFYEYVRVHHPTVLPMLHHPSVYSILKRHPQLGWMTAFSRLEIVNNLMNMGPATRWKSLNATPLEISQVVLSYPIKNLTTEELDREYTEFKAVFSSLIAAASDAERKEILKIRLDRDSEFQNAKQNLSSKNEVTDIYNLSRRDTSSFNQTKTSSCQHFYKTAFGLSSTK
jgi:hypothetical protein